MFPGSLGSFISAKVPSEKYVLIEIFGWKNTIVSYTNSIKNDHIKEFQIKGLKNK